MIQIALLAALVATPSTLPAQLRAARGGDTIMLREGRYGAVSIRNLRFNTAIRIDARNATVSAVTIRNSAGVDWLGGTLIGPRSQSFGVAIVDARDISVTGMRITGPRIGLSMARSTDIDVTGNSFDGVRSDGVNIAASQRVRITGNVCINFRPIRAIYASDGRLLVDGDHADCIQGWSLRGNRPTSDLTITDNVAEGEMQGITFFNPGEGGYDRITIRNNDMNLSYWHGIAVMEGRNTLVTENRVRTIPGARAQNWPFQLIRAWIYTTGRNNRVCGNVVQALPDGEGTGRC